MACGRHLVDAIVSSVDECCGATGSKYAGHLGYPGKVRNPHSTGFWPSGVAQRAQDVENSGNAYFFAGSCRMTEARVELGSVHIGNPYLVKDIRDALGFEVNVDTQHPEHIAGA
jgi:hypothetical protein